LRSSLSKDAPAEGARAEVARAVSGRMGQLGVSAAELRRRSGLSVNTIRSITEGASRHNTSTLVAISAVLEWPWDYLVNILTGRADKNVAPKSPLETHLAKLADGLAEIDALRQDVSGLKDVVHEIDRKIDLVIESQHASGGNSQPK
jgi:transcriptional regulator with XRE-family HTH domain